MVVQAASDGNSLASSARVRLAEEGGGRDGSSRIA